MRYYPKFLLIGDSIGEDTWNLTDLKTPAAFNVSLSDLTASEQRSASGLVVRDRIGTKRTLSLSYNALTDRELRTILQAVSPLYVYITYPDPLEGEATRQVCVMVGGPFSKLNYFENAPLSLRIFIRCATVPISCERME